jgi:hypothetical protein
MLKKIQPSGTGDTFGTLLDFRVKSEPFTHIFLWEGVSTGGGRGGRRYASGSRSIRDVKRYQMSTGSSIKEDEIGGVCSAHGGDEK